MRDPCGLRLYVLVRRDLSCSRRAVQACHALAELMHEHGADPWIREWADAHKTIVIVGVRGLAELLRWEQKLGDARVTCAAFKEPDLGGERTALAVHPSADAGLFRNLPLL